MLRRKDRLDRLASIFEMQYALQERLGNFPIWIRDKQGLVEDKSQPFITVQTLALIDEAMEALRETPWKPWKKKQELMKEKFKEELVDAWHFLINLTLASEMTADEFYERFKMKNRINNERIDKGY